MRADRQNVQLASLPLSAVREPSSDNTHLSIVSKPAYSQPQCPQLVGIGTRPALANAVHGLLCSDYRRSGMKFGRLPLAIRRRHSLKQNSLRGGASWNWMGVFLAGWRQRLLSA